MTNQERRDLILYEIQKRILGPGYASEIYVCADDASDEIIDNRPQKIYATGVLSPANNDEDNTDLEVIEIDSDENETDNEYVVDNDNHNEKETNIDTSSDYLTRTEIFNGRDRHIGLIMCLKNEAKKVNIQISYAIYRRLNSNEIKDNVKVKFGSLSTEDIKAALDAFDNNQTIRQNLNKFDCEGGTHDLFTIDWVNKTISPNRIFTRTDETTGKNIYLSKRDFMDTNRTIQGINPMIYDKLLPRLMEKFYFKRNALEVEKEINIDQFGSYNIDINEDINLLYKVIDGKNKKYLRVLIRSKKEYLMQTVLKVHSSDICEYSDIKSSSIGDYEYELNEEIYRTEPSYGKGVNCGFVWDSEKERPSWVRTEYMPAQEASAFSNATKYDELNDSCNVFDLSIWSKKTDKEIIDTLRILSVKYNEWHNSQTNTSNHNSKVLSEILNQQKEFLDRITDNINYLEANSNAMKCFRIANTAMYIQMCIARSPKFKKNRHISEYANEDLFNCSLLDFFKTGENYSAKYRPFQLAFLLMNVKSTFENNDQFRTDGVDLIWFPTGGGKTEAYLALTALTIAERRMSNEEDNGISVIMRYTLRLLTAQQFERASFLVCALEFLRRNGYEKILGKNPITIGMWIGKASTPNTIWDLTQEKYNSFFQSLHRGNEIKTNPMPVSYCPWCGCKIIGDIGQANRWTHGYNQENGNIKCINNQCEFSDQNLPILYIDEQLYQNPPTILFATVDKFAQLKSNRVGRMFGVGETNNRRPDLIIQDELHLISGPLGSLVGLFETIIEEICTTDNGRKPKIVASTATTRNTKTLVTQLYARNVHTFPVSGISYDDNFFSYKIDTPKRKYVAVTPSEYQTATGLEIRCIAAELVAKEKLIERELTDRNINLNDSSAVYNALTDNGKLKSEIDNYWSLVLYYMNLKSLGQTHSRIPQEIAEFAKGLRQHSAAYPSLDFVMNYFYNRTTEFTSRQESSKIKELLVGAADTTEIQLNDNNISVVNSRMDIIQATNMISVGIDIPRWNVMFVLGHPLTTAEYIQSSSRVGRETYGLVLSILNTLNTRHKSVYEDYIAYHRAFYKHVEPLTVSTFTENTIDRLVALIYLSYMSAFKQRNKGSDISDEDLKGLKSLLENRLKAVGGSDAFIKSIHENIDSIHAVFRDERIGNVFNMPNNNSNYKLINSMRDVEANSWVFYEQY